MARLAGLPESLLKRADEILEGLEVEGIKEEPAAPVIRRETALNLFSSPIIDELVDLDVMSKTPIEAMEICSGLVKKQRRGANVINTYT